MTDRITKRRITRQMAWAIAQRAQQGSVHLSKEEAIDLSGGLNVLANTIEELLEAILALRLALKPFAGQLFFVLPEDMPGHARLAKHVYEATARVDTL